MLKVCIFCFCSLLSLGVWAQSPIQLSGLLVHSDSLQAIPFGNILITNNLKGTTSNFKGYFSFTVVPSDTIFFSAIGYKNARYIIPADYQLASLTHIQSLTKDTILLAETKVTPWSNYEQFKHAFIHTNIKDDDIARAKSNLEKTLLKDLRLQLAASPEELQNRNIRSRMHGIENQGIPTTLPFLSPTNWIGLIKSIEDGSFLDFYSDNN